MQRMMMLMVLCIGWVAAHAQPASQPHILIILADDLGWNDVGYHGSRIETPSIDRIAREGIELDRFYVQPTCSPTRAGLMTGKLPMRFGLYRPINKSSTRGVPLAERLLPEYLDERGYQSFMVGKWHLGHHERGMLPNQRGFEHYYGSLTGGIGYWNKVHGGGYDWQRNGVTVREGGYVTHLLVDEIRTLIEGRDTDKPNFLYAAFQAPHLPNEAPAPTIDKYETLLEGSDNPHRIVHAAMVDELDQAIGQVLEIYEEQGMLDNTLVMFFSDNGGLIQPGSPETYTFIQKIGATAVEWLGRPVPSLPLPGLEFLAANTFDGGSDNTPLPGGKTMASEGGVRVPAAIWWPGELDGGTHDQPFTVTDVLPTLLDAIGAKTDIPKALDGRSQLAALRGQVSEHADYAVSDLASGLAMYRWPWKLVGVDEPKLYHLIDDPLEQTDLSISEPDQLAQMQKKMASWGFQEDPGIPIVEALLDPDTFGGEEDGRPPWAESTVD